MSALIRDAIESAYGTERSTEEDLDAMRQARGSWKAPDLDGAAWVERVRTGSRLRQPE